MLSEYLDLAFVLRSTGELVVNVRSATEALHCLSYYRPGRIVIDLSCYGAEHVVSYTHEQYPDLPVEVQEQVIDRILAAS